MPRILNKEKKEQVKQEQNSVMEVEITLQLVNQKLNYIISQLDVLVEKVK